ncbi:MULTISPECIES: autotransporter outer membrane beta-barrel domain-containing protein [unclassified Ruegeria]|uniref:beta strand repeat-containing protein n=1 Tax=unclassified Ruegeria TaxID=2625375 RepID=UPI00148887BA
MVKWKGQIASVAPSVFLASVSVAALSAGIAAAQVISAPQTTQEVVVVDNDITITPTGAINLTTTSGPSLFVVPDFGSTLTNNGTISGPSAGGNVGVGAFFDGQILTSGQIINNGTIDINAMGSGVSAGGLVFDDGVEGAVTNTGTITAIADSAGGGANAAGLFFDDGAESTATIRNDGIITAQADSDGSSFAGAFGFSFFDDVDTSVVNTGTITTLARDASSVTAMGLFFATDVNGNLSNSGSITATANQGTSAQAIGVRVNNDINGNLTNSGTISATGNGFSSATGWGYHIIGDLNGSLTNSGTLQGIANSTGASADGAGVYIQGDTTGNITNTGTVIGNAQGSTSATAAGLYLSGDLNGSFNNSGSISATANATDGEGEANGLYVSGTVTGNVTNSGLIIAQADGASSATAVGIEIRDGLNGQFLNSGTITVRATDNVSEEVEATGVYIRNSVTGNITNTGVIDVLAEGFSSATAIGFDITGGLNGNFNNSGTISVRATDQTDEAVAEAIDISGGVTGNITNSGTIFARADGESSGTAYGFDVSGGVTGNFNNSGTITVIATDRTSEAEAYGADISGGLAGNISNSGSISVRAKGDTSATAYGIDVSGGLTGNFDNSGTISVLADTLEEESEAFGLSVTGGTTGSVTNAGSIAATAIGETEATAGGLYLIGGVGGNITNSGTISVESVDLSSSAEAFGIYSSGGGTTAGNVTNSGTISVTARSPSSASVEAQGIAITNILGGSLSNTGSITAIGTSAGNRAVVQGIYLDEDTSAAIRNSGSIVARANASTNGSAQGIQLESTYGGALRNSGSITASAVSAGNGPSDQVSAAGIWVEDMQGSFANTGVISASASRAETSQAFGLYFENFDGVITRVGQISASSDTGDAYAIFLGTGTGTLNIVTTDQVNGLIRVQDHNVNLDAVSGGAVFRFEDAAPGSGAFVTTVSDDRFAWFIEDEDGTDPIYASVDAVDLLAQANLTAYYGELIGRSADTLSFEPEAQVTRNAAGGISRFSIGGFRPFALIEGESREFENIPGSDTDVTVFNGSAGYSGHLENGLALSAGIGVFRSDGDTSNIDFDTDGFYVNAAVGRQFGAYQVEAGLGYAWLSTDRTRQISGSSDAQADFDSTLWTVHLGAQRAFDVSDKIGLLGFGEVRYSNQDDDSYTETGSLANVTVGDSTTEVVEARLGIEIDKVLNSGGTIYGQLSGVVRENLDDTSAAVTLFSTTQTLSFAANDFSGGSIEIGYEHQFFDNMRFEANAEQEFGSDAQGPNFLAGLRWSF